MTFWLRLIAWLHVVSGATALIVVALGGGLPGHITSRMAEFDHGEKSVIIAVLLFWIARLLRAAAPSEPQNEDTKTTSRA